MKLMQIALATFILYGCCPEITEITRVDTLYIPVGFTDTLTLTRIDTVFGGQSERVLLRVDTLWKRAWVKVTDTIKVVDLDTVKIVAEKDPTLWNSKKYWIPALAMGLIVAFLGLIYFKKF